MRIAVFGAGGVGGYFGGRLAQAGEDVTFIARGEHLRALRAHGLRVESTSGDFTVDSVQATDDPASVGAVDLVLLAVKAWQVPDAARALQTMVGSQTLVLPLENGVDAPSQLAAVLGGEHVLGGLCVIISQIVGPGRLKHTGLEPVIQLGELDRARSERVERLREMLDRPTGMSARVPADIHVAMWRKFQLIASWSGVGSVTRAPAGIIRGQPETRGMLREAAQEIWAVAEARGIALPEDSADQTLAVIDGVPAKATASMQRDILEGRPSELDAQNGAVMRLGCEAHVKTPVNTFIYASLLALERRARGLIQFDS